MNINSREEVRSFYNGVYTSSEGVPINSSAVVASCIPGTNSTLFREAVLRRVNWFRAMAGMPASVTFDPTYNTKAQQAALMMSANDMLSSTPPMSWTCYTADGAQAAGSANLSLGLNGADAITDYINDSGVAGQRRWVLYPNTQLMGTGDMPAQAPHDEANALWIFDIARPRPATRNRFISWPPPGYTPYQVAFQAWSFSYTNANFSAATVTMRSNNVPMAVTLQPVAIGYGENTLVWVPANFFLGKPAADIVYSVAVSNVVISGGSSNFTYTVTVFDPATTGADSFPPTISGPSQVNAGQNSAYTFTAVSNATSYEWRQTLRTPFNLTDGAENGLGNFTVFAPTNLYSIIVSDIVASGTHAFHLAMTNFSDQRLTLNNSLYASANSMVTFKSRLGYATATQIAKVQASTDDGATWSDVYAQPGNGSSGEDQFVARSISLSSFAGSAVRLRFNYNYNGGSIFRQTDSDVGWLIDDIVVTNIEQLVSPVITSTSATNFNFNPAQAGNYNLEVRALIYNEFPLDWGPTKLVTASAPSAAGYSLQLDGADDYVEVPHVSGLNVYPLTITAWLKTTNQIPNSQLGVVNKLVATSSNGYNLFVSQGRIRASYFNGNGSVGGNGGLDGGPVANGRWHHVAFTVDASGGRIYVDGVLMDSAAWGGTPGATTTTEPLRMGLFPDVIGNSNYFGGMLDEVQIWNVARSEAQIQAGAFLPLTGSEANLVAYYRFDEAPGTATTADLATTLAGANSGNLSNGVLRVVSTAVIGMERPIVTSGQVRLNFGVPFGLPAGFQLQRVGAITGTWSNDTAAVLTTNTPGASFRFTTTTDGPRLFYRVSAQ